MALPTKLPPPIDPCPGTRIIDCNRGNFQAALDNVKDGDRLRCLDDFRGRTWTMRGKRFSVPVSVELLPPGPAWLHDSQSNAGSQCPMWIENCSNLHFVGLEHSDGVAGSREPLDGLKLDGCTDVRIFKGYFHDINAQGLIARYYCKNVQFDSVHIRLAGQGYFPVPTQNDPTGQWKDKEGKHAAYLGWSKPPLSEGFALFNSLIEEQAKGSGLQGLFKSSVIVYNTFRRFLMRDIGDDGGYAVNVWEDSAVQDQVRDNAVTSNLVIECRNGFQASKWSGSNIPLMTVWKNAFYKVQIPVRTQYGSFTTVKDNGGHVILQDGWTLDDLKGKGDPAFQPKFDYVGATRSNATIGHLEASGVIVPPPPPPLPDDYMVITNLQTGQILAGIIPWSANVLNGAPEDVEFYIDDVMDAHVEHIAPYDFGGSPDGKLDTNKLENDQHKLEVRAKDASGRKGTVSVSVRVNNKPSIAELVLTVPVTTNKKTSFIAKWTPPVGVKTYKFYGTSASVSTNALQSQVKFGKFPGGQPHEYKVEAYNAAGQVIAVGITTQK